MLKDLTNAGLIRLNIQAENWEDAVRKAAQPFLDQNKVRRSYVEDIISGAKESGPYFVIAKHVALPHARPEAGALDSAIGIATLKPPVAFGSEANDPVKYLFCLSAKDSAAHLDALADLAERLEDEEFFRMLDEAENAEEVIAYLKK